MDGLLRLDRQRPNAALRSASAAKQRRGNGLVQEIDADGPGRGVEVRVATSNGPPVNESALSEASLSTLTPRTGHAAAAPSVQRCVICRQRPSAYTCPQCNIPYCSLPCFRHVKHATCAQAFQQSTLRSEFDSGSAGDDESSTPVDEEERRRMMDILLRLQKEEDDPEDERAEEENGSDGWSDEEEEGGDRAPTDIERRAQRAGIELADATFDELMALLSIDERAQFKKMMSGEQDDAGLRKLLASGAELEPWWKKDNLEHPNGDPPDSNIGFATSLDKVRLAMPIEHLRRVDLRWNVIAVVVTYVYLLRHLEQSQGLAQLDDMERNFALQLLEHIVPFVFVKAQDATSSEEARRVLQSAEDVTLWLVSRLEGQSGDRVAETMSFLLQDALAVLRKPKVSLNEGDTPALGKLHIALGDLHAILSAKSSRQKIVYYAVYWTKAVQDVRGTYEETIDELEVELKRLQGEVERAQDEDRWHAAHQAIAQKSDGVVLPS